MTQVVASIPQYKRHVGKIMEGSSTDKPWLFRGQGDANWRLQSTLERALEVQADDSLNAGTKRLESRMSLQAQTVWALKLKGQAGPWSEIADGLDPDTHATEDELSEAFLRLHPCHGLESVFPNASSMISLRHHGVPSPFLDFTSNYLIAFYFALSSAPLCAEKARVFVVQEREIVVYGSGGDCRVNFYVTHHRDLNSDISLRHKSQEGNYIFASNGELGYPLRSFEEWWMGQALNVSEIDIDLANKHELLAELSEVEGINANYLNLSA